MDKFLETNALLKMMQEERKNLNRPVTSKETECNQKPPNNEKPRNRWLHR